MRVARVGFDSPNAGVLTSRLFLDTEWAVQPDNGVAFVNLGIVSEDERFVFYAECDPFPEHAPEFVH